MRTLEGRLELTEVNINGRGGVRN